MNRRTESRRPGRGLAAMRGLVLALLLCLAASSGAALAQEAPTDILAAAVRTRGFACDRPLGAERAGDPVADRAVWILRCGDGTYRVTLSASHVAQVEKLN